jgi:hypothetical protein
MNRYGVTSVAIALLVGAAVLSYVVSEASAASAQVVAKVRLYSNGAVVGEWNAVGAGKVEGDTFVFPTQSGPSQTEVRISGTFSYEETR